MTTRPAPKSASLRAKRGSAKVAELRQRGSKKEPTTYNIGLSVKNSTGAAIAEFWIGHYSGKTEVPPTIYNFYRTDTVGPIANNATFSVPGGITLIKGGDDQWMFYWRQAGNNNLNGLKSQWFKAEVKHQDGTATLVVRAPDNKISIEQNGKTKKSTDAVVLQTPGKNVVLADMFGSATGEASSISAMFDRVGVTPPSSWGSIGVCLSGGGTRAMTAGMGQLQALAKIQYKGKNVKSATSLLSQVRAISSVSGGGWVAGPYTYLKNLQNGQGGTTTITDDNFLNTYVPPDQLTTTKSSTPQDIGYLPPNNIGHVCTSGKFGKTELAMDAAALLWASVNDPSVFADRSMVWQTLVGTHLLEPYELFSAGVGGLPNWTYSYNQAALASCGNKTIEPFYFYADQLDATRPTRPFHVANMSMEVKNTTTNVTFTSLAQATPLYTGMFGSSSNVTTLNNSLAVGGGGVSTFGFNSLPDQYTPVGYSPSYFMNLGQVRQWSLADSIGVSSAFIGAGILTYLQGLSQEELARLLREHGPQAVERLHDVLPADVRASLKATMTDPLGSSAMAVALHLLLTFDPGGTIPKYSYWSPNGFPAKAWPTFKPSTLLTEFADGGMLENLGLASLLSYTDITAAMVFVNSAKAIAATTLGAFDASDKPIPYTNVLVDGSIPPLFGYMEYDAKLGYLPFGSPKAPGNPNMAVRSAATAQIFPSSAFAALLQGLWDAATNQAPMNANAKFVNPAVYLQANLPLQKNDLFNVAGGRSVNVLWCHLNASSAWTGQLSPSVARELPADFPHYSTWDTEITKPHFNLLANLAAWSVVTTLSEKQISRLVSPPDQSI